MSAKILTVTLNPAVDISSSAEVVRPVHKIRTSGEVYDPGGGGVNVARVVHRLGGDVSALYLAGGPGGNLLEHLLDQRGIRQQRVPARGNTRMAFNVYERATGLEYRFVPEGPEASAAELEASLDGIRQAEADYIVVSGSLPRGAADDMLVEIGRIAKAKGARLVVDSSGTPLYRAIHEAEVYLIKPSLHELGEISGRECDEHSARGIARQMIRNGKCTMMAITLGAQGATLVTADDAVHLPARHVMTKSAVGAGDSFLGAMVWALAEGWSPREAFRLGVAAGAAAAMTPGTELCYREDVFRLYEEDGQHPPNGSA